MISTAFLGSSDVAIRCLKLLAYGLCGLAVLFLVRKQWRIYHFSTYRRLLKRIQFKQSRPTPIRGR